MRRAAFLALLLAAACGGDTAPKSSETGAAPKTSEATPSPAAGADTTTGAAIPEPAGVTTDAPEPPPPPATKPHEGPCKVRWSDGARVSFLYSNEGGSVFVDQDGDGNNDTCGTFKAKDGHTTYARVDEGCDKATDATVRIKWPTDDKQPVVGTGTVTRGEKKDRITVVPMPSFSGISPGYVLEGSGKQVTIEADGPVVNAVQTRASGGRPARRVTFGYDDAGRIATVEEDVGIDDEIEVSFRYEYDEHGNVNAVTAAQGDTTRTATLDYRCWDAD